jgi:hypothetical protein
MYSLYTTDSAALAVLTRFVSQTKKTSNGMCTLEDWQAGLKGNICTYVARQTGYHKHSAMAAWPLSVCDMYTGLSSSWKLTIKGKQLEKNTNRKKRCNLGWTRSSRLLDEGGSVKVQVCRRIQDGGDHQIRQDCLTRGGERL